MGKCVARWAVNFIQMRYTRSLVLNCCPSLINISCYKRAKLNELSLKKTQPPKLRMKNRKINEQPKFSLDVEFVWILQKQKSSKYGYGRVNAHIVSEMI